MSLHSSGSAIRRISARSSSVIRTRRLPASAPHPRPRTSPSCLARFGSKRLAPARRNAPSAAGLGPATRSAESLKLAAARTAAAPESRAARYSSRSSTPASFIPPAPAGFLGELLGFAAAAAARASARSAGGGLLAALAAGRVSLGCGLLALAWLRVSLGCALLSSAEELRVI